MTENIIDLFDYELRKEEMEIVSVIAAEETEITEESAEFFAALSASGINPDKLFPRKSLDEVIDDYLSDDSSAQYDLERDERLYLKKKYHNSYKQLYRTERLRVLDYILRQPDPCKKVVFTYETRADFKRHAPQTYKKFYNSHHLYNDFVDQLFEEFFNRGYEFIYWDYRSHEEWDNLIEEEKQKYKKYELNRSENEENIKLTKSYIENLKLSKQANNPDFVTGERQHLNLLKYMPFDHTGENIYADIYQKEMVDRAPEMRAARMEKMKDKLKQLPSKEHSA